MGEGGSFGLLQEATESIKPRECLIRAALLKSQLFVTIWFGF